MSETAPMTGSRAQPRALLLVLTEVAAALLLLVSILYLPWFRYVNHGEIVAIPPGSTGLYLVSWSKWQGGFVGDAVMLTLAATLILAVALVARMMLRRRWTRILLVAGFAVGIAGAIESFGSVRTISPVPGAVAAPESGLLLFAGAAVVGLGIAVTDLAVSWRNPNS
jgi:hypothetical protein